ncbi:hypothetical protein QF050_002805 [Arthrobacter sp. SLBN-112]|nr:hypothetical protein [Arthrobacter sp. SLBN-112]
MPGRAPGPVVPHQVPLAKAAAKAPGLNHPFFFLAGAAGQVREADGMTGVHGGDDVIEGLPGRLDPGLHAGGEFNLRQPPGGLDLAQCAPGRRTQRGPLPELRSQQQDSPFLGSQLDIRQPVGFLADPVTGCGGVVFAPAGVRQSLDVEAH